MDKTNDTIEFVDTEIAGDVIRVVTAGIPELNAPTPAGALEELKQHHEALRRFLICPPRGHADVNAALLLPPFSKYACRTVVIAAQFGYAPLAGTPLIAAATVLAATGVVVSSAQSGPITFDTANGLMEVTPIGFGEKCTGARWNTSPPQILRRDHILNLPGEHPITVDVVLTGLPYVVVTERVLGVISSDVDSIGSYAKRISLAATAQLPMASMGIAGITDAYPVLVVGEPEPSEHGVSVPLAWVYANGVVAKMPAGTGALTAAASLVDKGKVPSGTTIEAVSPFGGTIRSTVGKSGESFSMATHATVEADVAIVSKGHLIGYRSDG